MAWTPFIAEAVYSDGPAVKGEALPHLAMNSPDDSYSTLPPAPEDEALADAIESAERALTTATHRRDVRAMDRLHAKLRYLRSCGSSNACHP